MKSKTVGSQVLLQRAVQYHPNLLLEAFRAAGAVEADESLRWVSPLRSAYTEYRDAAALEKLEIADRLRTPLADFWPSRGCVWDGLAIAEPGRPILVEAKAHIPEMVSPKSAASSDTSKAHIAESIAKAQRYYGVRSKRIEWGPLFYQYVNRLAYQYFLRDLNGIQSSLVFLYFTNATDMEGPATTEEWLGATRLVHTLLGLPHNLEHFGVFHAFLDARVLPHAD